MNAHMKNHRPMLLGDLLIATAVWVKDGPTQVGAQEGALKFSFPTEKRQHGQIRVKLENGANMKMGNQP